MNTSITKVTKYFLAFAVLLALLSPAVAVFAETPPTPSGIVCYNSGQSCLIPCGGVDCNFGHFIQLFKNIMLYLVYIAFPISAVMFAFAGWLLISSGDNPSQRTKAKTIMWKVGVGFAIILAAWLIVNTITSVLLDESISPLS